MRHGDKPIPVLMTYDNERERTGPRMSVVLTGESLAKQAYVEQFMRDYKLHVRKQLWQEFQAYVENGGWVE